MESQSDFYGSMSEWLDSQQRCTNVSVATYDETGFIDYLDVFNDAVNDYTTLTVAAGTNILIQHGRHIYIDLLRVRCTRAQGASRYNVTHWLLPRGVQAKKSTCSSIRVLSVRLGICPNSRTNIMDCFLLGQRFLFLCFGDAQVISGRELYIQFRWRRLLRGQSIFYRAAWFQSDYSRRSEGIFKTRATCSESHRQRHCIFRFGNQGHHDCWGGNKRRLCALYVQCWCAPEWRCPFRAGASR